MLCESSNITTVAGERLKSTLTPLFFVIVLISIKSGVTACPAEIVPALTKAVALDDQLFVSKSMRRETSSIIPPPDLFVY